MNAIIELPTSPDASTAQPQRSWVERRASSIDSFFFINFDNLAFRTNEDETRVFEQTLYALCKANRRREAIAEALNFFDDRLIGREFRECDRALRQLQVSKLASSVLVSVLGVTLRAKQLKGRAIFFERAFQEVARQKGKGYARELLAKYQ